MVPLARVWSVRELEKSDGWFLPRISRLYAVAKLKMSCEVPHDSTGSCFIFDFNRPLRWLCRLLYFVPGATTILVFAVTAELSSFFIYFTFLTNTVHEYAPPFQTRYRGHMVSLASCRVYIFPDLSLIFLLRVVQISGRSGTCVKNGVMFVLAYWWNFKYRY